MSGGGSEALNLELKVGTNVLVEICVHSHTQTNNYITSGVGMGLKYLDAP